MKLMIIVILAHALPAWCEEQAVFPPAERPGMEWWSSLLDAPPPALPDHLSYPVFGRMLMSLDPYSGTGPYHFDSLSSSPYYARYKDVEVGLRIGIIYPLSGHLMLEFQLPFTANPSPAYQAPPEAYGPLSSDHRLDASVGLLWSF